MASELNGQSDPVLRAVVFHWLNKIEHARDDKRQKFDIEADQCRLFYHGPRDWRSLMSGRSGMHRDEDVPDPYFQISVNKAFELVSIFGPALYYNNPVRTVSPRAPRVVDPRYAGDPYLYQAMVAGEQQRLERDTVIAGEVGAYLDWTPLEGNLHIHSRQAIEEGLVTGRGCLWTELVQPPGCSFRVVASMYDTVNNLFVDPDAERLEDATWIARRCIHPVWKVERDYGLPAGTLQGNLESMGMQGQLSGEEQLWDRKLGRTNDLFSYWKIYSKMGIGGRLSGINKSYSKPLEMFGDFCFLAVAKDVTFPLNLPPAVQQAADFGAAPGDVMGRVAWPTPYWPRGWPVSCHDPETQVLTDAGWKFFADLDGSELLATVNLETDTLEYQKPTKLVQKRHVGDMIRFSGQQKLDMLVTPDHRMVVYPANSDTLVVKTADTLCRSDRLKVSVAHWRGVEPELPEFLAGVDTREFAEWLGFYIAEGCCANRRTSKGGTCSWQVMISQKKPEGIAYYQQLVSRLPFHHHPHCNGDFIISSKALWQYLRPLGNSRTKCVPQWVKDAPQDVIAAFLRGYIKGDGHESPTTGQITSFTASPRLADDLQELWLKAGKSASLLSLPALVSASSCALVKKSSGGVLVRTRKRAFASLKNPKTGAILFAREGGYDDVVYCASVRNGTLVTRRNGQPIISGNCLDFHKVSHTQWPLAHLKAGMGELKFLNWAMSFLAGRMRHSCRDFVAVKKSAGEELKTALLTGRDFTMLEIEEQYPDIQQVVQFLSHPEVNGDIWKVIAAVEENFDKRTGLTELMYGNQGATQIRSSYEAQVRTSNMNVRPDDMAKQVESWMTEVAIKEGMCARWHLNALDIAPVMGEVAASVWQTLVRTRDLNVLARQLEYRIEAGSARKPNRDTQVAQSQEGLQSLLPIFQQYATQTNNFGPMNALIGDWARARDLDPNRYMLAAAAMPAPGPPMPNGMPAQAPANLPPPPVS